MRYIISAVLLLLWLGTVATANPATEARVAGVEGQALGTAVDEPGVAASTTYTLFVTADIRGLEQPLPFTPADMTITGTEQVFHHLELAGASFYMDGVPEAPPYSGVLLDGQWHLSVLSSTLTDTVAFGDVYAGDAPDIYEDEEGFWHFGQGDDSVSVSDFTLLMAQFGRPRPGGNGEEWHEWYRPNFNLDDAVDVDDFNLLLEGFGRCGATVPCSEGHEERRH